MKDIDFVEKLGNPPNVPQAIRIEIFWPLSKSAYSKRQKTVKYLQKFRTIWKKSSRKVAKFQEKRSWKPP